MSLEFEDIHVGVGRGFYSSRSAVPLDSFGGSDVIQPKYIW